MSSLFNHSMHGGGKTRNWVTFYGSTTSNTPFDTFSINFYGGSLEYCTGASVDPYDSSTVWTTTTTTSAQNIPVEDGILHVRGTLSIYCYGATGNFTKVDGPVNALMSKDDLSAQCLFYYYASSTNNGLFGAMTSSQVSKPDTEVTSIFAPLLEDASGLILTTNKAKSFKCMFSGCQALTKAPDMSGVESVNSNTCQYMFSWCKSLVTMPNIEHITLAGSYCFDNMMLHCEALTAAYVPTCEISSSYTGVYASMFRACKMLFHAPALPSTTLSTYCYNMMFQDCVLMKTPPALPAINLANYCYSSMFNGCTDLVNVPKDYLSTKNLASYCYENMFKGCTSLTTPPDLPATVSCQGMYYGMFMNCTALTVAPNASADYPYGRMLVNYVSQSMYAFMFCHSGITHTPDFKPTGVSTYGCQDMFSNCLELVDASNVTIYSTGKYGYYDMFYFNTSYYGDVSKLKYPPKFGTIASAPSSSNSYCFGRMLYGNRYLSYVDLTNWTGNPQRGSYNYLQSFIEGAGTASGVHNLIIVPSATLANWEAEKLYISSTNWGTGINQWSFETSAALRFTGDSSTFTTLKLGSGDNMEISDDGVTYVAWDKSSYTVTDGVVYVRGKSGATSVYGFQGNFTKVTGPVMALVDYENWSTVTINDNQFHYYSGTDYAQGLFFNGGSGSSCPYLEDASGLVLPDATARGCYFSMFRMCVSLKFPPSFTTSNVSESCYRAMFRGCSALLQMPEFSTDICAERMFQDTFVECTGLTDVSKWSGADTIYPNCYNNMFGSCTNIVKGPSELPATTISTSAYTNMFANCTSMETVPIMSQVTAVEKEGCKTMFKNCIGIESAPDLSNITSLGDNALNQMFLDCDNLYGPVFVPESPWMVGTTTTAVAGMFSGAGTVHPVASATDPNDVTIKTAGDTTDWANASGADTDYWMFIGPTAHTYTNTSLTIPSYPGYIELELTGSDIEACFSPTPSAGDYVTADIKVTDLDTGTEYSFNGTMTWKADWDCYNYEETSTGYCWNIYRYYDSGAWVYGLYYGEP